MFLETNERYQDVNYKFIKSAFVFQDQPYGINYKPFIHIKPSPNGKSSEQIIKLLL